MNKIIVGLMLSITLLGCVDTNGIVDQIDKNNLLESKYIGFAGGPSDEFKRFEKLSQIATNDELKVLMAHSNPIVRTYAFQIMIERGMLRSDEAFKLALPINEEFAVMNGDNILTSDVCSEIYLNVLEKYSRYEEDEFDFQFIQNKEIDILDSLIIFKLEKNHFLHHMALTDKKHHSSFDDRIRELAFNQKIVSALLYIDINKIDADTVSMIEAIQYNLNNKNDGTQSEKSLKALLKKLKTD